MDQEDWNQHADGWDEDVSTHAFADAAAASLERLSTKAGVPLAGARVLDFGCGTGLLTERLAAESREVVAVDSAEGMIAVIRRKIASRGLTNVHALHAVVSPSLLETTALLAPPFDFVVCSSVCAFLENYPAMVALLATRLRAGGLFVQWDWEYDAADDEPFGLTRDAVRAALTGAGLEVELIETAFEVESKGHRMAPLMAVGRAGA